MHFLTGVVSSSILCAMVHFRTSCMFICGIGKKALEGLFLVHKLQIPPLAGTESLRVLVISSALPVLCPFFGQFPTKVSFFCGLMMLKRALLPPADRQKETSFPGAKRRSVSRSEAGSPSLFQPGADGTLKTAVAKDGAGRRGLGSLPPARVSWSI